jgi:hypothetical protein
MFSEKVDHRNLYKVVGPLRVMKLWQRAIMLGPLVVGGCYFTDRARNYDHGETLREILEQFEGQAPRLILPSKEKLRPKVIEAPKTLEKPEEGEEELEDNRKYRLRIEIYIEPIEDETYREVQA